MSKRKIGLKDKTVLVRVVINPADASQDQYLPNWAVQHFIVQGLIVKDLTNGGWCSKDGKRLPFKE